MRFLVINAPSSLEQLAYEQFVDFLTTNNMLSSHECPVVPKPINLIQDYLNFGFIFSTFW